MTSRSGIAVVVDAARDVLGSLSNENVEIARATIERWVRTASPLLRRLAVNGVREAKWMGSDEKLVWLLDQNLLYDPSVKHETFEVLMSSYKDAREDVRQRVLDRVKRGIRAKDEPRLNKEIRDYERYNLLHWLVRAAPNDGKVRESFRLEQKRNPTFGPRDDPDLEVGEVRAVAAESSMTVDRLLKMRAGDIRVARRLVDFKDEVHWYDRDRYAFLEVVSDATATNPDWGLRLAGSLGRLENWDVDLWRGLVQGWARAKPPDRTWISIFAVLADHKKPLVFIHEAGRLLFEFIQGQDDSQSEAVKAAARLSDALWMAVATGEGTWVLDGGDWLTAAINEPGGKIVEFWIRLVSLRVRAGESGLAEEDRARLSSILSVVGPSGEAGRILLASQFHFLLALDRDWTVSHILPLFDWEIDERAAEQAWDGFLRWTRLNEAVIETMLPMYVASFPHLAERTEEWRRNFTDHLALIAVRSSRNPVEDEWLVPFVTMTSTESRAEWTSHVAFLLRSLESEGKRTQWEKWIARYWRDRLSGIPRTLAPSEAGELAAWAVSLQPVFREAAELLIQGPEGRPKGYVYHQLEESRLPEHEPLSVLRFFTHVLAAERPPFYACHYALLILPRIPPEGLRSELEQVVNLLVGLGCSDAVSVLT